MGHNFSLGNFQLRLDPEIEAEIRRLGAAPPSPRLRSLFLNPNWAGFQQSNLDWMLRQPPAPGAPPAVPRGAGPATPRAANVGDLARAVWNLPAVQGAAGRVLDDVGAAARRGWNTASPGQRALFITHSVVLSGGAIAGILSHDQTRTGVLDFLSGKNIPVPGVDGLTLQLRHDSGRGDYGAIVGFDVAPYLPSF
ncbi:MAG: hypothetical protein QNJ40_19545 [Xanthomonadales bacterium]|nr:hypothetical protein [Xanthomonadales bacterium]